MAEQDHVDRLVSKWRLERPEYNLAPVQIIGRLARIVEHVDRSLESVFQEFELSRASFDVLATLRRAGSPYKLSQRDLMKSLMRTSGSVSIRIDAMERHGLVAREAHDDDRRATVVALTEKGRGLLEQVAPRHLENEEQLLSALTRQERSALVVLLRKLLLSLESPEDEHYIHYGLTVLHPQLALQRRRAVGLPDVSGMLIHAVEPNSIAEQAGLRKGDLITAIEAVPTESQASFRRALNQRKPRVKRFGIVRGADRLEVKVPAEA